MPEHHGTRAFVFTDIEASTRGWEQQPEQMRRAVELHDAVVVSGVEAHHGAVVKTTGDGVMAVFDDPLDAVTASVAVLDALASADWGPIESLKVRVGIHAGAAEERGGDYFGPNVNRTARIMAVGHGGQILVSDTVVALTAERLGPGITYRDLGEHRLKDLAGGQHIYQVSGPDRRESFPPLNSLDLTPNNLPSQTTELLGRDRELNDVRELLDSPTTRLVTLVGPGGTGKTRLAVHAAADQVDRFPDGVRFVDLADSDDTDGVFSAIARTIAADARSEDPPATVVARAVGEARTLFVLDNFEQVVEAGPAVVNLLGTCPHLNVIVTSREALHVRGEHILTVAPLTLPPPSDGEAPTPEQAFGYEAIALFVARAQAIDDSFVFDEGNVDDVVAICRRLDGLPLAIELATARLRLFQPGELRARLEERLDVLRGGARDLPTRHRALSDTIAWSVELLSPEQQTLFRTFSVFSGATLEAVDGVVIGLEHVDEVDVIDGLDSLVAKSLIRTERTDLGTRFSMLETIREFARAELASLPEEQAAVRRAHADYYADLSRDMRERLRGSDRARTLIAAGAGLGNLRTAWSYWVDDGDVARLQDLLETLWALHDAQGQYHGALELASDLLAVLEVSPDSEARAREAAALQMSVARAIMAIRGYTTEVEQAFTRALEMQAGVAGAAQFPVLRSLATLHVLRAETRKALDVGRELLVIAEADGSRPHLVDAHLVVGANLGFEQDMDSALAHLDQAIDLFDPAEAATEGLRLGPNSGVVSMTSSAFFLWTLGFPERADLRGQRAIAAARDLRHPYSLAYALYHVAFIDLWNLNIEGVARNAAELHTVATTYGYSIWEALAIVLEGFVEVVSGGHEAGLSTIEHGIGLYESASAPPVFWGLIMNLRAAACLAGGQPEAAERFVNTALEFTPEASGMLTAAAVTKADVLVATGAIDDAIGWYERAESAAAEMAALLPQLTAATRLVQTAPTRERVAALGAVYGAFTEGHRYPLLTLANQTLETAREALEHDGPA